MLYSIIFSVTIYAFSTYAAVPPYIKVCSRQDPKLDQCILESVKFLEPKLREGIPELDIPSTEPFHVKQLTLVKQADFEAIANDVAIYGLSTYDVPSLHVDLDKQQIEADIHFKDIKLLSTYSVDARILVPVTGTGPLEVNSHNVTAKVILRYKLLKHKGKEYMHFHSMTTKLIIVNFEPKFEIREGPDSPLAQAINSVAATNQEELIKASTPNIEKVITETILTLAGKITKHFTYEELFPETL